MRNYFKLWVVYLYNYFFNKTSKSNYNRPLTGDLRMAKLATERLKEIVKESSFSAEELAEGLSKFKDI